MASKSQNFLSLHLVPVSPQFPEVALILSFPDFRMHLSIYPEIGYLPPKNQSKEYHLSEKWKLI